jgi:hypothetical protein
MMIAVLWVAGAVGTTAVVEVVRMVAVVVAPSVVVEAVCCWPCV